MKLAVYVFVLVALIATSCGGSGHEPRTATSDPASATTGALPITPLTTAPPQSSAAGLSVIYDDDGSPDGTVALLYLLVQPEVDVISVNLTYGEAYPEVYIQHLARLMDAHGIVGIPLGYGEIPEATGAIHFPEFVREASSNFWGRPSPNPDHTYPSGPAAEQIVAAVNASPRPVTIFVSGPSTNLAPALSLDPGIKGNIGAVYMMGGAVHVPGNVHDFYSEHPNVYAEWNMVADPVAANEVFEADLPIYLVPLDATNQVTISRDDTQQWRTGGGLAEFSADLYDQLMDGWGAEEAAVWDPMTAAIMIDPQLCEFTPLHLAVVIEQGDTLGQTAVVVDKTPNVAVCLNPDADSIRRALIEAFSKPG